MTAQQYIDLATQFNAMARSVETLRKEDRRPELRRLEQRLLNEASDLDATAILSTLDKLEPHYDAMLSVIRDLKNELASQSKIESVTNFADKALAIGAAFRAGDVGLVITSINEGIKLVKSVRA